MYNDNDNGPSSSWSFFFLNQQGRDVSDASRGM